MHKLDEYLALQVVGDEELVIVNKKTGRSRQIVDKDGMLLVEDGEINVSAISEKFPHFGNSKRVESSFGVGIWDTLNGYAAVYWRMDDHNEEVYCIINPDLEIIVPFQPMDDVSRTLENYEGCECKCVSQKVRLNGGRVVLQGEEYGSVGITYKVICDKTAFAVNCRREYLRPEDVKLMCGADEAVRTYRLTPLREGRHIIYEETGFRGTVRMVTKHIVSVERSLGKNDAYRHFETKIAEIYRYFETKILSLC